MAQPYAKSTPLLLQAGKEFEHEGVRLLRLLLLDPVTGAGNELHGAEVVGDARHGGAQRILLGAADDDVVRACDEGDGNLDARASELGRDLPVAVEVAVVVYPATEARLAEFG